jgi:hypothetical protein
MVPDGGTLVPQVGLEPTPSVLPRRRTTFVLQRRKCWRRAAYSKRTPLGAHALAKRSRAPAASLSLVELGGRRRNRTPTVHHEYPGFRDRLPTVQRRPPNLVLGAGLEPARLSAQRSQHWASTVSPPEQICGRSRFSVIPQQGELHASAGPDVVMSTYLDDPRFVNLVPPGRLELPTYPF